VLEERVDKNSLFLSLWTFDSCGRAV